MPKANRVISREIITKLEATLSGPKTTLTSGSFNGRQSEGLVRCGIGPYFRVLKYAYMTTLLPPRHRSNDRLSITWCVDKTHLCLCCFYRFSTHRGPPLEAPMTSWPECPARPP